MERLIDISVRRPVAVAMLYGALALLAVAAWGELAVEVEPSGDYPRVTVETTWTGASPETLQALVTSRIEALAAGVPGVLNVRSETRRERSTVTIELSDEVDLDLAVFELNDRLALLREELPPGAGAPQLQPYVPRELEDLQGGIFYSISLRGPRDLNALRSLALDEVRGPLLAVEGVAEVEVWGGEDPYLRVSLDPALGELYGVRPVAVMQAIEELDRTWPVGRVEVDGTSFAVRVTHRLDDLEPLRSLPVGRTGESPVRLADVADVSRTHDAARTYTRVDGMPVVEVRVHRRSGTDVLAVARRVRRRVAELDGALPDDVTVEVIDDEAAEMEAELGLLGRRLALVLVIVAALLFALLRDLRTPLVLFGSLAAALALAVVALYHARVPVNVLTLTGLALAFGMLVDNAVVALESVARHREEGLAAAAAARRGTTEVVVPILASTLTTIGVFFPFVLFQDRLRDYYLPLALAIALSLTASLIVAVTLMPAAAARGWTRSRPRLTGRSSRAYRRALRWGLRHPWLVILVAAAGGFGAWAIFQGVPAGGFGGRWWSRDRLHVSVGLPSGAEAARTDATIRPFERYVLGLDDTVKVKVRILGERGTMEVLFPPDVETTPYPLLVKENLIALATRYAGLQVGVSGFDPDSYFAGGGFGPSYGYGIKLLGFSYDRLGEIGREIVRTVKRSVRVRDAVVTSGSRRWSGQGSDVALRIDRERLAVHRLTTEDVMSQLRALLPRPARDRIRVGGEEWEYRVEVAGSDRRLLRELLAARIPGAAGAAGHAGVRVSDVVDVAVEPAPGSITRENQRYERWVRWEYRGSPEAGRRHEKATFDALELPSGYTASLQEPFFLTREERLQIREVAIIALVIVFMVLASLYESLLQPLVVMLSVPFALVGVALIFRLTGRPFDASASVGVILLGGIVVNNAVLMVDQINRRRRDLGDVTRGILEGAAERVRPILITSITTVGGLLPLVLVEAEAGAAGRHDVWSSLALATIGGLTAATFLTLSLTPILYSLVERGPGAGRGLARRVRERWRRLPG